VDHALCTGDLTQVSRADEFEGVARVFADRLQEPNRFTVIPGNHDRYIPSAAGLFERSFSSLSGSFPFVKHVAGVRIIGLDPCRPTSLVNASGLCGDAQRERLRALLEEDTHTAFNAAMTARTGALFTP